MYVQFTEAQAKDIKLVLWAVYLQTETNEA